MSFFPKIKFVDEMPKREIAIRHLKKGETLEGTFGCETKKIYILRQRGQWKVLLHELGHWTINIFVSPGSQLHNWLDWHF